MHGLSRLGGQVDTVLKSAWHLIAPWKLPSRPSGKDAEARRAAPPRRRSSARPGSHCQQKAAHQPHGSAEHVFPSSRLGIRWNCFTSKTLYPEICSLDTALHFPIFSAKHHKQKMWTQKYLLHFLEGSVGCRISAWTCSVRRPQAGLATHLLTCFYVV